MRRAIASTCVAITAALLAATPPSASADPTAASRAAFVDAPQRYVDATFVASTTSGVAFATVTNHLGQPQTLRLDLSVPAGDTATDRPAIVFVHGGSFCCGNRSGEAARAALAAQRGYVAVTIDYRLRSSLDVSDPDQLGDTLAAMSDAQQDAQAAVRWLRANAATYEIDPDRISISGYSAGAVTALRVALHPDLADAAGPNQPHSSAVAAGVSMAGAFGGSASAGDPPIVMFHGTLDTTVAYALGRAQCDVILEAGNVCEWHEYVTGHSLPTSTVHPILFDFLYRHVSCGEPFSDVALPHPFCGDIDWSTTNALANGYADGTFRPTASLTRQALLAMLWRMAGAPMGAPDPSFTDVGPTHPFRDAIAWAVDAGLAQGYADNTFRPTATVSRQAAVAWQWAMVGEPTGAPDPGFGDVPPTNPFLGAIAWAADAGVTSGYADGGFHPGAPVSRQAGVAQLHRTAPLLS